MPNVRKDSPPGTSCLLLHLPDGRRLLSREDALNCLVEFARTFSVRVELVRIQEAAACLDLESLVAAVCSGDFAPVPKHEVVAVTLPGEAAEEKKDPKAAHRAAAAKAREDLTAKGVCLASDLVAAFPEIPMTAASRILNRVVKNLCLEGFHVVKDAPGIYHVAAHEALAG